MAGRITSSIMKNDCETSVETSALSLISKVCYPNAQKLNNPAIQWSLEKEDAARQKYIEIRKPVHKGLTTEKCGLFLCPEYPHIDASPDGTVTCDCCGTGCLEIKCPYSYVKQGVSNHSCYTRDKNLY